MWCRKCYTETSEKECPECHSPTIEVPQHGVYWCHHCNIPVLIEPHWKENHSSDMLCPLCKTTMAYLSSDLRPVFPEERLLIELLLGRKPNEWIESSVWAANSRYYVDGKGISISLKQFENADISKLQLLLEKYKGKNSYHAFNIHMKEFVCANAARLNYIKQEAIDFIKGEYGVANPFPKENIVLSFSGGKDSSVTADVVIKALADSTLTHIFGDTTLEFPMTYDYVQRYINIDNPDAAVMIAKNDEQVFYSVCEDIGPPARMMRWCCSMFKTGPITRLLNDAYPGEQILTFYGIRKCESVSRSKYKRLTSNSEFAKIQKQTVAAPIFFWSDLDVWLYIISENVDFNDAYRLGYDRVGCWCCPNNNIRAQFLARIYMPEASQKWRNFLIDFAKRIGKPDPEVYVDTGRWKARQGGNGLAAANDVKIKFTHCTVEDHAKIYSLVRPFDDTFIDLMIPFGIIAPELGRKLIHETIIVDVQMKVPIISIQPFSQDGYDYAVKIKTMNVERHGELQRMIGYQVRKFNACRKCLKCESVCKQGAIVILGDEYRIDSGKCVRCRKCVSAKYLDGGCMMEKYLKTKKQRE